MLQVAPRGWLQVRVVDGATGKPLGHSLVCERVERISGENAAGIRSFSSSGYSSLALGPGEYRAFVSAPPVGSALLEDLRILDGEALDREIVIGAGTRVRGRLTGRDAQPLRNAKIVLRPTALRTSAGTSLVGRSDARGDFRIRGVAPGTYAIEVVPPPGDPLHSQGEDLLVEPASITLVGFTRELEVDLRVASGT